MALFRDTNGTLRLGYFEKMSQAEAVYDLNQAAIKELKTQIAAFKPGSGAFGDIAHRIEDHRKRAGQAQDEMNMYSAALTAISTALLTK